MGKVAENQELTLPTLPTDYETISRYLAVNRQQTFALASGLGVEDFSTPAKDYLSPPNWDVGHILNFQELWLVQELGQRAPSDSSDNEIYNSFKQPRQKRPSLPLLCCEDLEAKSAQLLARVSDVAKQLGPQGVAAAATIYWMIHNHEHQHQETLMQSIQLRTNYQVPRTRQVPSAQGPRSLMEWCQIPGGNHEMGVQNQPGVYDIEGPRHTVNLNGFRLAKYPVTVSQYLRFMKSGGYYEEEWWSPRGQQWLAEQTHLGPLNWRQQGDRWQRFTHADGWQDINAVPDEILCHVSYFEAEAYANWMGCRLPTEAEWDCAARSGPTGTTRNPWGDQWPHHNLANIGQLAWKPSNVGSYPQGEAPHGPQHLVGDVWEWLASDFEAFPGFEPYPYDEYSKVFLGGDYKMLRGGSWASQWGYASAFSRNWDHPYRKQIFAGIRLAKD